MKLVFPDGTEQLLAASETHVSLSFTEEDQLVEGMPMKVRIPNTPYLVNLPEIVEGTLYIVPSGVAFMANRSDFIVAFPMYRSDDPNLTVKNFFKSN